MATEVPRPAGAETAVPREYSGAIEDRDGCTCPPWVRCVHFGELRLWLADTEGSLRAHKHEELIGEELTYFVAGPTSEFRHFECCQYEHVDVTAIQIRTHDYLAALAEFRRRERELLGRADA